MSEIAHIADEPIVKAGQETKQFLIGLLSTLIKSVGNQKVSCEYNIAIDDAIETILFHYPNHPHEAHIICLASAKHYRLRPAMTAKAWIISLVKIGDRKTKFVAKGETYWQAEAIAREHLNNTEVK